MVRRVFSLIGGWQERGRSGVLQKMEVTWVLIQGIPSASEVLGAFPVSGRQVWGFPGLRCESVSDQFSSHQGKRGGWNSGGGEYTFSV
ncbi:hypothetical protein LINPERHAP1_LOCUS3889 [Linum perenne]